MLLMFSSLATALIGLVAIVTSLQYKDGWMLFVAGVLMFNFAALADHIRCKLK